MLMQMLMPMPMLVLMLMLMYLQIRQFGARRRHGGGQRRCCCACIRMDGVLDPAHGSDHHQGPMACMCEPRSSV
jgi:hypothetical protein